LAARRLVRSIRQNRRISGSKFSFPSTASRNPSGFHSKEGASFGSVAADTLTAGRLFFFLSGDSAPGKFYAYGIFCCRLLLYFACGTDPAPRKIFHILFPMTQRKKIPRFFNPFSFPYIATSPAIHYYNMEGNSIITVSIA